MYPMSQRRIELQITFNKSEAGRDGSQPVSPLTKPGVGEADRRLCSAKNGRKFTGPCKSHLFRFFCSFWFLFWAVQLDGDAQNWRYGRFQVEEDGLGELRPKLATWLTLLEADKHMAMHRSIPENITVPAGGVLTVGNTIRMPWLPQSFGHVL